MSDTAEQQPLTSDTAKRQSLTSDTAERALAISLQQHADVRLDAEVPVVVVSAVVADVTCQIIVLQVFGAL